MGKLFKTAVKKKTEEDYGVTPAGVPTGIYDLKVTSATTGSAESSKSQYLHLVMVTPDDVTVDLRTYFATKTGSYEYVKEGKSYPLVNIITLNSLFSIYADTEFTECTTSDVKGLVGKTMKLGIVLKEFTSNKGSVYSSNILDKAYTLEGKTLSESTNKLEAEYAENWATAKKGFVLKTSAAGAPQKPESTKPAEETEINFD
jgi:hypothetical protein